MTPLTPATCKSTARKWPVARVVPLGSFVRRMMLVSNVTIVTHCTALPILTTGWSLRGTPWNLDVSSWAFTSVDRTVSAVWIVLIETIKATMAVCDRAYSKTGQTIGRKCA